MATAFHQVGKIISIFLFSDVVYVQELVRCFFCRWL